MLLPAAFTPLDAVILELCLLEMAVVLGYSPIGLLVLQVLVGIRDGDTYPMPASEARRGALGIKFSRRMGEVYARAIKLVQSGKVDEVSKVTHHPSRPA